MEKGCPIMRSSYFFKYLFITAAVWISAISPCFASDEISGIGLPLDASITSLLGQSKQCLSPDASQGYWGVVDQMDEYFQLGHDQGNAIETPNIAKNTIWFAKPEQIIRVCFDNQDKNSKNTEFFERAFKSAWEAWRSYLVKNPPRVFSFDRSDYDLSYGLITIDWGAGGKLPIAMNYEVISSCDESTDLRIIIGSKNQEIEQLQLINNHPVAFAQRKFLEHSLKWSKGFIYIADSSQVIAKMHSPVQLNWEEKPKHLENVFLHEIGHVLGVPHIEGTIMRSDLYQQLLLNKWSSYFNELAIDHQNRLYDDCGENKILRMKLGSPSVKYKSAHNPNLDFLNRILNIKLDKKLESKSIEIELNYRKLEYGAELPSKRRYRLKRDYKIIFKVRDEFGNPSSIEGDLLIDLNSQELTNYQPIFNQLMYYRSGFDKRVASVGIKSACHASIYQNGIRKIEGHSFPVSIKNNSYKSKNRNMFSISKKEVGSGFSLKIDYGIDFAEFELVKVLD